MRNQRLQFRIMGQYRTIFKIRASQNQRLLKPLKSYKNIFTKPTRKGTKIIPCKKFNSASKRRIGWKSTRIKKIFLRCLSEKLRHFRIKMTFSG